MTGRPLKAATFTPRRWSAVRRWELVATWGGRVPGLSGTVVPASTGLHFVRGRLRAAWTAWRWSRQSRRECIGGPAHPPPYRWRVRPLTTRRS